MAEHGVVIHPLASRYWGWNAPSLPARARDILRHWKDVGLPVLPLFPLQDGEAGKAALRRARGRFRAGEEVLPALTYPDLQSLATRYRGLTLRFPERDVAGGSHYENAKQGPGQGRGDQERPRRGDGGTGDGRGGRGTSRDARLDPEPSTCGSGKPGSGQGEGGGSREAPTCRRKGTKRRRGSRGKNRHPRRRAEAAGGGAGAVWVPAHWRRPSKDQVRRARRLLEALREEAVEAARETLPIGWDKRALAVRGELAQPDRARRWERLGLPTLILALDFSGSINYAGMTEPLAVAGAALGEALPWLVIMDASNGEIGFPLIPAGMGREKEVVALWGGRPWTPRGWPNTTWEEVVRETQAAGVIYVGDWEDDRILGPLRGKVPRLGALSVWESSWRPPTRTDYHYGVRTPWPTVVGCGSVEDVLTGLELLLAAWREMG